LGGDVSAAPGCGGAEQAANATANAAPTSGRT